jgi:hemerythrin-like domain-containing protein
MKTLDTNAPLTNFSHCHDGILAQMSRLSDLPALIAPAALARQTAAQTLAFFQGVMHAHHQEEEEDLFPAVLASAEKGEERMHIDNLIEGLVAGHRALEKLWHSLVPELKKVAKGQDSALDLVALNSFIERYKLHAAVEEQRFLPLAETILSRNGNHMAALGLSLHMRHLPMPMAHI